MLILILNLPFLILTENPYLRRSKKNKIIMGKGDVKTKRGKIVNGSFGVSRPHKAKKAAATVKTDKKA